MVIERILFKVLKDEPSRNKNLWEPTTLTSEMLVVCLVRRDYSVKMSLEEQQRFVERSIRKSVRSMLVSRRLVESRE
jgi:hypothetical protein